MPRTLLEMAEDAAAGVASADDMWTLEAERRRRVPTVLSYADADDFVDMPYEDEMEQRDSVMTAKLYLRKNGAFGAECDSTRDTGHRIVGDSGRFTVYSVDDDEKPIAQNATREEAEKAIAADWRKR